MQDTVKVIIERALHWDHLTKLREMRTREIDGYSISSYDRYGCIFTHIPKAAGVSVARAIFGNLAGGHATLKNYRWVFGRKQFDNYYKFSFVRNPWDRLVSAFVFLKKGGMNSRDAEWARVHLNQFQTFDDFVLNWVSKENAARHLHFIPQSKFLTINGSMRADFVGKYETIDSDFRVVTKRLGISCELPHMNSSRSDSYRDYFNSASKKVVSDVYAEDIERFGYTF